VVWSNPVPEPEAGSLLSRFQQFQASARPIDSTGDAALDLLLSTSPERFADLVRKLCVPHWFTAESIALLGGEPDDVQELLSLPFVRLHPLGHTYHDEIRRLLRASLIDKAPSLYLDTCRKLHAAAQRWMPEESNEETEAERLYLWIAVDAATAFPQVEERIHQARQAKRINLFDTLVHVLEEQAPVLDSVFREKIEYYRGLLLYDQRAYSEAIKILRKLRFEIFDAAFAATARFRVGIALEGCGSWKEAEVYYRGLLKHIGKSSAELQFRAKVLHRLAQVAFSLRQLAAAEKYARASLQLDREGGARYGEAINLRLLGVIYEKLRDQRRAKSYLESALEVFSELEIPGEIARSLNDVGNLLISFGEFDDAGHFLAEAAANLGIQGDTYGLAFVYANLGKVAVGKHNQIEEALRHYKTALALFQQTERRQSAPQSGRSSGASASVRGRR
jgi:tetratricopeptide (TPR) repeat protein